MQTYETLRHTTWECKYHIALIPKWRKKVLFGGLRPELGPMVREPARQKEREILEGHLMPDHVHMPIAIPPKYSVAQGMGFIKGKCVIHIARVHTGRQRSFAWQHFWARGYWLPMVGRNEAGVRRYIVKQEQEDRRLEQLELGGTRRARRAAGALSA